MSQLPTEAPFGVVDMGSNGIRFGIVSALSRHLPVAYEERAPISLFDAQGVERVIPEETICQVVTSFRRFQQLCEHAGVKPYNVKIIATEATRLALNSQEFIGRIFDATGWSVSLLSKEEEALISASGIVGSFYKVDGVTMDLGGGSVEFSYVTSKGGELEISSTPVSLPYGAAALKRRLGQCTIRKERKALHAEIVSEIQAAIQHVNIPPKLQSNEGYTIYMSGGGFRALGYLSMKAKGSHLQSLEGSRRSSIVAALGSQSTDGEQPQQQHHHHSHHHGQHSHQHHNSHHNHQQSHRDFITYPIPIISGYTITGQELQELANNYKNKDPEKTMKRLKGFRISKRRAGMVPAICFLVSAMLDVLQVRQVHFSEGGVRQGLCYTLLSPEEQRKDPLLEGVKAYASGLPHALSCGEHEAIWSILQDAVPRPYLDPQHPLQLHRLLSSAIHLANLTTHYPKETRAFVAFHMPLASGPLANVPGITHQERATLALLLAFRQGGEVPDPIFKTIQRMLGRKGTAVCKYVGRLMELLFTISPLSPGMGVAKSGISFVATVLDDPGPVESSESSSTTSSSYSSSSMSSSPAKHKNKEQLRQYTISSGTTANDENNNEVQHDPTAIFYPRVRLCIHLPKNQSCPMVEAPAVMSVIESMGQKISFKKKFEMDEELRSILAHPNLFSVDVIRSDGP
ncbi:Ppx/GppA phosphatase family-domain-containing protein [Zychaea mexicana]|uniref:Ppx/GppA phosphatase family-domain-containing protein n=1 Tax=Zychaea mexicana TaxID=64656 RepID=UPI0022FEE476|nr:Ppx/GppA phosphatase family-domain-containing protein [Zychaea mexicana]KAI9492916.1 Ppx/GppA phosphatase family-domain-containing protein [Zychaea mexicana]